MNTSLCYLGGLSLAWGGYMIGSSNSQVDIFLGCFNLVVGVFMMWSNRP